MLIALFLGGIGVATIRGLAFSEPAVPAHENRVAAPWPKKDWSQKRFERWFNDRLGFRRELLGIHATSKWDWFGVPSSSSVAVGPNGWLFLRQSSVLDQPAERRTGVEEHVRQWIDDLNGRQRWLAERGIRYLVVIAPDKQSIYPEEMPASLQYLNDKPLLDEFVRQAGERGLEVLDLRPALREAKKEGRVYLKYDTHWNGVGSWHATRTLLGRLGVTMERDHYAPAAHPFPKPDLVRYLGNVQMEETWETLVPIRDLSHRAMAARRAGEGGHCEDGTCRTLAEMEEPRRAGPREGPEAALAASFTPAPHGARLACSSPDSVVTEPIRLAMASVAGASGYRCSADSRSLPKTLFLHDSFGIGLADHARPYFSDLVCEPTIEFPKHFIERHQPSIVIQEMAERTLKARPSTKSPSR